MIADLGRRAVLESYDEQPLPQLDYEALDFAAASESFSELRTLRPQDLRSIGLVVSHQGREVPTIGGFILFGRNRLERFPDAWIQAGRFVGMDKSRIADQADLRDYPVRAIKQAIGFVERNTQTGAEIGRLRRRDVGGVPPSALREALVNAVVHADYSQSGAPVRVAVFDDRVEIESPGILLPGLTIEDLGEGVSRLRNRVIGRAFRELGLVEPWGSGIQRMIAACTGAGLAAPEFRDVGLRFRVTLRTVSVAPPATDDIDRQILEFVGTREGRSTAEIAARVDLSLRAVQHRLASLTDCGLVAVIGTGPRDPRRRWFSTRATAP